MGTSNRGAAKKVEAYLTARSILSGAGLLGSDAGLSSRAVSAEVLMMLPAEFAMAYEALFLDASGLTVTARDHDEDRVKAEVMDRRTSTNQVQTMRGATEEKKRGAGKAPVGSEAAMARKQGVDRKLRAIARGLRGEASKPRRCTKKTCRKWSEPDWNYCPFDGSPTENVDD